jgi:hypothetical protein
VVAPVAAVLPELVFGGRGVRGVRGGRFGRGLCGVCAWWGGRGGRGVRVVGGRRVRGGLVVVVVPVVVVVASVVFVSEPDGGPVASKVGDVTAAAPAEPSAELDGVVFLAFFSFARSAARVADPGRGSPAPAVGAPGASNLVLAAAMPARARCDPPPRPL